MKSIPKRKEMTQKEKTGLHPRNIHRKQYDFETLKSETPELAPFVTIKNKSGDLTIDFANPAAVIALNKALLGHFYQIKNWELPSGNLCPPIPSRADYIHYMADILAASNEGEIPKGHHITGLDIGTGAVCVYPILGHQIYGWKFIAADIDRDSIKSSQAIIKSNRVIRGKIQCRLQKSADHIFTDMIHSHDRFDFSVCNPPFHNSLEEAKSGTARKIHNLELNAKKRGNKKTITAKPILNFGGQESELTYPGGELDFIKRMIRESALKGNNCFWFSTLVSKKDNLPEIYKTLKEVKVVNSQTIQMQQGQKIGRIVAWTFLTKEQQKDWRDSRWA